MISGPVQCHKIGEEPDTVPGGHSRDGRGEGPGLLQMDNGKHQVTSYALRKYKMYMYNYILHVHARLYNVCDSKLLPIINRGGGGLDSVMSEFSLPEL